MRSIDASFAWNYPKRGLRCLLRPIIFNFLLSLIAGALVFALTFSRPYNIYFAIGQLVAGLVLGLIRPYRFWVHYFGVLFGQLIYAELFTSASRSQLILLGGVGMLAVILAVYSLIALTGAAIGAGIRRLLRSKDTVRS